MYAFVDKPGPREMRTGSMGCVGLAHNDHSRRFHAKSPTERSFGHDVQRFRASSSDSEDYRVVR